MYLTVAHLFLDAAAVVELKTSVSSRVAYLDYHCFFSPVGWRFPSLWRQPGSQSRHVTLKPLYGFHCTKGHPSFLTCIVWLDFEKKKRHYSGFLIPNSTVHQIMTDENPISSFDWNCWQSILLCVFTIWCMTWWNIMFCVGKFRYQSCFMFLSCTLWFTKEMFSKKVNNS